MQTKQYILCSHLVTNDGALDGQSIEQVDDGAVAHSVRVQFHTTVNLQQR